jgi:hypothetical protein
MASFLALNGGAAAASILLAAAARDHARASGFLLRVLCGYLVLLHAITLLAGLAGHLDARGLMALVVAALAGAVWVAWQGRGGDRGEPETSTRFTAAALFTPLAAAVAAMLWAWPHVFAATRLWIWDDYTYHMVYPTLWLREHAITPPAPAAAFTMQAWYPLGASVVAAWFMTPFAGARADALAWVSLTGPLYGAILALAIAALLDRLGCRRGAWALPVVLLFTSHRIDVMASSFSDADLAHASLLFAALAFAVPRHADEGPRDVAADAIYAALLTGMALGVKVSAAPAALVVAGMVVTRSVTSSGRPRRGFARRAAGVGALFLVCWTATSGYWYLRNIQHTGNPVYPAAFLLWPGTAFPETTLLEYARRYGAGRTLRDALTVYLNWPLQHALMAVAGVAGLGCYLAWRRTSLPRPQRYFAWGALVTATAVLLALPRAPYSAGNAMTFRSGFIHWDSMRYVGLLPILGWAALGFLVDGGAGAQPWRALVAAAIAVAALLTSGLWPLTSFPFVVALGVLAIALAATRVPEQIAVPLASRRRALATGAAGAALAVTIAATHATKARATADTLRREPLFGAAAAVLDRQPPGTRVALFGDQWVYPAFGARHDLVPLRLDGDGRVAAHPIADAMSPGSLDVDPATFRANLRAAAVDVIVVVHLPHPGRSAEWPAQHAALEGSSEARLLHRDGAVAVWQLTPERGGEGTPRRR